MHPLCKEHSESTVVRCNTVRNSVDQVQYVLRPSLASLKVKMAGRSIVTKKRTPVFVRNVRFPLPSQEVKV